MIINLYDYIINFNSDRVKVIQCLDNVEYYRRPVDYIGYDSDSSKALYEKYYNNLSAFLPQQCLYLIKDVAVRGKGVITLDKYIIKNNLEGAPIKKIEHDLCYERSPASIIREPVFYALRYGVKNYGHCLTDIIPRIVWFHALYPNVKIIVHKDFPKQIKEALLYFGLDQENYIEIGDEHIYCEVLYFMDLWNSHPLTHSPRSFDYLATLKDIILSESQSTALPRKIFINRHDARNRHIINHLQVSKFFEQHGYFELSCGYLNLVDQVRYFSAADTVVGLSGAAMTNMVFCKPNTTVINISPSTMPSLYFWDLASHLKINYKIIYFQATHPEKNISSDLYVDVARLSDLLE